MMSDFITDVAHSSRAYRSIEDEDLRRVIL
jgi:hypothetical protein